MPLTSRPTQGDGGKDSESNGGVERGMCYLPPSRDEVSVIGFEVG